MEILGAWLFVIGFILSPIIFIICIILYIKYKNDLIIRELIFEILMSIQFLCWACIVVGMLLVYYF